MPIPVSMVAKSLPRTGRPPLPMRWGCRSRDTFITAASRRRRRCVPLRSLHLIGSPRLPHDQDIAWHLIHDSLGDAPDDHLDDQIAPARAKHYQVYVQVSLTTPPQLGLVTSRAKVCLYVQSSGDDNPINK